jgi:hypothetical protein
VGKPTGLAAEQLRTLDRLRDLPVLKGFYLAGGTAVAHHLRHRRSLDLDLFSANPNAKLDTVRAALRTAIASFEVISRTDATLRTRIGRTAVDIVRYPYPPLERPVPGPSGFLVAGLRDLAAMKLAAIAGRGIRRDFWDLHEILGAGLSLADAAHAYLARFGKAEADLYHVMRALTYFADAEGERRYPAGLTAAHWRDVTTYFRGEAPKLLDLAR